MTTTAAPYRWMRRARSRNAASPSLSESELTTALPCTRCRPVSSTDQSDESIITGTRAIAGSAARRLRNRPMTSGPSSMASSTFTSMIWAPPATCCAAMATAASSSPATMALANRGLPAMFVRSPTFTNVISSVSVKASRPDRRSRGSRGAGARGGTPATASAIARMCSGVLPQQPPTTFSRPARANSPSTSAICSGVSSYSPNAFGSPAFGCADTSTSVLAASSRRWGRSSSAPSAQFRPTENRSACAVEMAKASGVWPDSVRPLASVMVPESMIGARRPTAVNASSHANSAAFALSVSKTVSMRTRSTPPSRSATTCSVYASASWLKVIARKPGRSTSGESEAVRLVGPTDPATHRRRPSRAAAASTTSRAIRAAARFISRTRAWVP